MYSRVRHPSSLPAMGSGAEVAPGDGESGPGQGGHSASWRTWNPFSHPGAVLWFRDHQARISPSSFPSCVVTALSTLLNFTFFLLRLELMFPTWTQCEDKNAYRVQSSFLLHLFLHISWGSIFITYKYSKSPTYEPSSCKLSQMWTFPSVPAVVQYYYTFQGSVL